MSTIAVTTVQTANGSTDLTLQTGNTSAGKISIPASGAAVNVSANVTVNGSFTTIGNISGNTIVSNRTDAALEGGQLTLKRASDNADMYAIDVYGSTTTPDMRMFNMQTSSVFLTVNANNNITVASNSLNVGTSSISANGYSRLPNGLLFQWGTSAAIGQDSSGSVTFPIAFTTLYCITITGRQAINTTSGGSDTISTQNTSSFTIAHGADGTSSFYWMAIGV